ncbi:MAG: hypothetical protein JSR47_23440 [Proteobacteria bacterium]|nr:hypothetical protein [Pseudomonadota bacterium]
MKIALRLRPLAWRTAMVAFVLSGGLASGEALAQQQLTEPELRALITGKAARWDTGNLTEYHADGTFSFKGVNVVSGKWEISGGKVCYHRENASSVPNCDLFYRDSTGPYIVSTRGVKYRFTVVTP